MAPVPVKGEGDWGVGRDFGGWGVVVGVANNAAEEVDGGFVGEVGEMVDVEAMEMAQGCATEAVGEGAPGAEGVKGDDGIGWVVEEEVHITLSPKTTQ